MTTWRGRCRRPLRPDALPARAGRSDALGIDRPRRSRDPTCFQRILFRRVPLLPGPGLAFTRDLVPGLCSCPTGCRRRTGAVTPARTLLSSRRSWSRRSDVPPSRRPICLGGAYRPTMMRSCGHPSADGAAPWRRSALSLTRRRSRAHDAAIGPLAKLAMAGNATALISSDQPLPARSRRSSKAGSQMEARSRVMYTRKPCPSDPHLAADIFARLLALHVTPTDIDDRAATTVQMHRIELVVVRLPSHGRCRKAA